MKKKTILLKDLKPGMWVFEIHFDDVERVFIHSVTTEEDVTGKTVKRVNGKDVQGNSCRVEKQPIGRSNFFARNTDAIMHILEEKGEAHKMDVARLNEKLLDSHEEEVDHSEVLNNGILNEH